MESSGANWVACNACTRSSREMEDTTKEVACGVILLNDVDTTRMDNMDMDMH